MSSMSGAADNGGGGGKALPSSVLFMCSLNTVRSPMAEALLKHLHGSRIYVQSCGVQPGEALDPLVAQALAELGLEIGGHVPRGLQDIGDASGFDLIITLSPEAHHHALELTRTAALEVEYWQTMDPTAVFGTREQRLTAYRLMRDDLLARLKRRFPPVPAAGG